MPASKRFLHPDAIARISRLDLRARWIVEGFLSGQHRSPYFGQSVEFVQHRAYVPGDDLRHLDWKIWAKQDRFYIKQYEEETNLRCTLLVDLSESMLYGQPPWTKREYACTAAVSLAYLLLRQQDAVGCISFDDEVRYRAPQRSARSHLSAIIQTLATGEPRGKTDISGILTAAGEASPQRGLIVLISDLLADRASLLNGLRALRQRGHEVLVFHVLDPDELTFPFSGPTRFEDLEGPSHVTCNPRALRDGYLAALQTFLDEVRRGCAAAACDYVLSPTNGPLDALLAAYLHRRQIGQTRG